MRGEARSERGERKGGAKGRSTREEHKGGAKRGAKGRSKIEERGAKAMSKIMSGAMSEGNGGIEKQS